MMEGQSEWENSANVAKVKPAKEPIHPIIDRQLTLMQVRYVTRTIV